MKFNYISMTICGLAGYLTGHFGIFVDNLLFWAIIVPLAIISNSIETFVKNYFEDRRRKK